MSSKARIAVLDELRGLCVVLMVIHHACYTLGYYMDVALCRELFVWMGYFSPLFAGIFITLCGFCCTLSHNNPRRGGLILLVAAGISAVMAIGFPDDAIWFGVLHLLGCCVLLFALCRRPLGRLPAWAGIAVCAVLFVLCYDLPVQGGVGYFGLRGVWRVAVPETIASQPWLYPLGLGRLPGTQGDYYPLLPWMFLFFIGTFLGRFADRIPASLRRSHVRPLAFVGRHALWVYILHQPVIYGVSLLIFSLL